MTSFFLLWSEELILLDKGVLKQESPSKGYQDKVNFKGLKEDWQPNLRKRHSISEL